MPELLIVLVVALLVLGPRKLPEVARSLGRGMAEFRRASSDLRNSLMQPIDEIKDAVDEASRPVESEAASDASKSPQSKGSTQSDGG